MYILIRLNCSEKENGHTLYRAHPQINTHTHTSHVLVYWSIFFFSISPSRYFNTFVLLPLWLLLLLFNFFTWVNTHSLALHRSTPFKFMNSLWCLLVHLFIIIVIGACFRLDLVRACACICRFLWIRKEVMLASLSSFVCFYFFSSWLLFAVRQGPVYIDVSSGDRIWNSANVQIVCRLKFVSIIFSIIITGERSNWKWEKKREMYFIQRLLFSNSSADVSVKM